MQLSAVLLDGLFWRLKMARGSVLGCWKRDWLKVQRLGPRVLVLYLLVVHVAGEDEDED